jgi:inhibitor of cysteine peptidase
VPKTKASALALGLWLACCGGETTLDAVHVTEAESGHSVGLAVGQELFVTLQSNWSTGYGWSFQCSPDDVLSLVGEPEYRQDEPVRPGSGGEEIFRFSAVRSGEATVDFEYRQPWDTTTPPAIAVEYHVVVQ